MGGGKWYFSGPSRCNRERSNTGLSFYKDQSVQFVEITEVPGFQAIFKLEPVMQSDHSNIANINQKREIINNQRRGERQKNPLGREPFSDMLDTMIPESVLYP